VVIFVVLQEEKCAVYFKTLLTIRLCEFLKLQLIKSLLKFRRIIDNIEYE